MINLPSNVNFTPYPTSQLDLTNLDHSRMAAMALTAMICGVIAFALHIFFKND